MSSALMEGNIIATATIMKVSGLSIISHNILILAHNVETHIYKLQIMLVNSELIV